MKRCPLELVLVVQVGQITQLFLRPLLGCFEGVQFFLLYIIVVDPFRFQFFQLALVELSDLVKGTAVAQNLLFLSIDYKLLDQRSIVL